MYLKPTGRPSTDTEIFVECKPMFADIGPKSSLNKTPKGYFSSEVCGMLVNVGTIAHYFVIPLESNQKMSNSWKASSTIGGAIGFWPGPSRMSLLSDRPGFWQSLFIVPRIIILRLSPPDFVVL